MNPETQISFAPRDAKIIKENPGKSPYELKTLGLSEKAFDKLMSQPSASVSPITDHTLDENNSSNGLDEGSTNDSAEGFALVGEGEQSLSTQPPAEDSPLVPKITSIDHQRSLIREAPRRTGNQVFIVTPNGRRNTMGREFALKLKQLDPRYQISD